MNASLIETKLISHSLKRLKTFHRIRINRTNRVRAKARKRRADEREGTPENGHHHLQHGNGASGIAGCSSTPCPICGQRMYGSAEELNQHVVQCLRRASFLISCLHSPWNVNFIGIAHNL